MDIRARIRTNLGGWTFQHEAGSGPTRRGAGCARMPQDRRSRPEPYLSISPFLARAGLRRPAPPGRQGSRVSAWRRRGRPDSREHGRRYAGEKLQRFSGRLVFQIGRSTSKPPGGATWRHRAGGARAPGRGRLAGSLRRACLADTPGSALRLDRSRELPAASLLTARARWRRGAATRLTTAPGWPQDRRSPRERASAWARSDRRLRAARERRPRQRIASRGEGNPPGRACCRTRRAKVRETPTLPAGAASRQPAAP